MPSNHTVKSHTLKSYNDSSRPSHMCDSVLIPNNVGTIMYFLARLTMTGWKMNNKTIQNMHLKLLEDYPKNLEVPPNRFRLLQGICLPNDASIHFSFGIYSIYIYLIVKPC